MLGYHPEDFADIGYEAYTNLLHPDDYERTMQAMRDHLEGRAPLYQIDYRIRRSDGAYTWYMDHGCIIERTADGGPLRIRGLVLDLGEQWREHSKDTALMDLIRRALPSSSKPDVMVSLCCECKRLKLSEDQWIPVEDAFPEVFSDGVSHAICPDCIRRLYPQDAERLIRQIRNTDGA